MLIEIIKFFIYTILIVIISKYALVKLLRRLTTLLNLSAKAVGNISGMATSMPELLTVCFSSVAGLVSTSIYNIISSNAINFIQYLASIIINKNYKIIKNKAIKIDLFLSMATIIFPVILVILNVDFIPSIVPFFLLLFSMFYYINNNAHKLYLTKYDNNQIEDKNKNRKITKIIANIVCIVITSVILFFIGDRLSSSLENLALIFNVPEKMLGIVLGFVTSLPELITFFESQKHYNKEKNEELGVVEATNNLLTSNILNLFVIQSFGIFIFTIFK